jgi:hypothetical protein
MLVVLGAATLAARFAYRTFLNPRPPERFAQMVDALPAVQAEKDHRLVLFFGSSMIEDGFSTVAFDGWLDQHGVATTSFNLGCRLVGPDLLHLLAKRTAKVLGTRGVKADAVYLEFPPHLATRRTIRERTSIRANAPRRSLVSDSADELHFLTTFPDVFFRESAVRLLGNRVTGELKGTVSSRLIQPVSDRSELAKQMKALRSSPLAEKMRQRESRAPAWDPSVRGDTPGPMGEEERALVRRQIANRAVTDPDNVHTFTEQFDFFDLDFDPALIDELVAAYAVFHEIAERVYVVLLPRESEFPPSPVGKGRLSAVLERFRREGIPLVNTFDDPSFVRTDFAYLNHLNHHVGRDKFSTLLAGHFAKQLAEPPK